MLYDRWCQVVSQRADQLALVDLAADRWWTFRQLAAETETGERSNQRVVFPKGNSADFILTVLRAWSRRRVICPLESSEPQPHDLECFPAEIVHLKITSATGGIPRLVAFTASQLTADAETIVTTMGLREDWPNLGVISLAHSYGFSNLVLPLLLHGIPLILAGGSLPEVLRRGAGGFQALTLAAVPALWQNWYDAGAIPPNVRLAISAGAPLPLGLEETVFARNHLKIHNFYGSSECGGIAFDGSSEPRQDAALSGTPLQGVKVTVGDNGCLKVRSDAVGETYWPESSPVLDNGVFHTNDLGEVLCGKIFLRGRAGDQINVAGRKVAPEAIEQVLAAHPEVRACLAFGVPSQDTQRGELIVACVAARRDLTDQSLRLFALEKLPAWQVPREWWVVDSLEVNGRGKVSRTALRKRYLAEKQKRIAEE